MASENRETPIPVVNNSKEIFEQSLQAEPYQFDFFQAVRRLECLYVNKPRLGESPLAKDDAIRLAEKPSLRFAPASLASFDRGTNGFPPRLAVYFLGLLGPNGPMPIHLTEYIRDRVHNASDHTLASFLDIFHHRMLSLFYRAWANSQPTVSYDRPESDNFARYIGSLFGLGMPSLRKRDAIPDYAKLYYAGHFAGQTRHAEGLESILSSFFRAPVSIEQFVGHWLNLPAEYHWRLGESALSSLLGKTTTIGESVFDCQSKFRIVIGPLGIKDYMSFLPGKFRQKRLIALVRQYIGDELSCDLKLILKKEELPQFRLGETGQLGWTTWLDSEAPSHDDDSLILEPIH